MVQLQWLATGPDRRWQEVDGTLVMADVSGFTKLAERLSHQGKIGSEELTEVLNGVFHPLLDVAANLGGDCLKFGGDALFLLFTGPGHAERACRAAMQMGRIARIRHPVERAGTVRLNMSLGVDSGRCHLFMVGRSHSELIVAGPLVSRTLEMEAVADAGEVLVSESTAALLDASCLGPPKGGGRLLATAPTAEATPPRPPVPRGVDAIRGVPVSLRAHISGDVDEGEHRLATIAFVPFAGTDRLLMAEGPEATAAALDDLIVNTQDACARHEVSFLATDVNRDGGKIILAAGMPAAIVEGEERMLHALRDLVGAPTPFEVRAGVNQGRVFSVDLGAPARRAYTVMGDEVNLAARVAFKGEVGQVVATDRVLSMVRTRFSLTPLEPFYVKGKSNPISAQVVGAVEVNPDVDVRSADDPSAREPLIGRESDLAVLRGALAAAEAGRGCVVEIVGEPGIGKTRLVAELTPITDRPWGRVEGGQYARAMPYFALRRPLQAGLGLAGRVERDELAAVLTARVTELAPELVPWIPMLGVPFGVELEETAETAAVNQQFRRTKMHAVVLAFLKVLLPDSLVLIVEDAHWLDRGSADILYALLTEVGHRCWTAFVLRRDVADGLVPEGLEDLVTMPLTGLDDETAMKLAAALTENQPLPRHIIQELVDQAGGNPLFIRELVAASGSSDVAELPATVEEIVAASVDTLAPVDRQALRSAAVLGTHFHVAELEQLAKTQVLAIAALFEENPVTTGTVMQPVIARLGRFLVGDGPERLRFRNVLLRDVAYEGLPYRTRRRLHGHVGLFIERLAGDRPDDAAELLALHFHAAGKHDKAWVYSRAAGLRAQRNGGLVEAAAFFQWALEAARALHSISVTDQAELTERLGDVCEISARYPEAMDAYRRARRLRSSDPLALAWLCKKEGWVRERSDRYSQALRWYARGFRYLALVEVAPGDGSGSPVREIERCRAELTLAQGDVRLRQGRYRDAIPLLRVAAEQAEHLGERATLANAYTLLYWALADLGTEERHRYQSLALPIFEELGDHHGQAKALNNLGAFLYYEGQWDEAIDHYRRSAAAHGRAGDVVAQVMTVNNVAEILRDRGKLDEAEELFKGCLQTVRAAQHPLAVGYVLANMGLNHARAGRLDEAGEQLALARARLHAIGADEVVLETDTKECERLVLAGDADAALDLARATLREVNRLGGVPSLSIPLHRAVGYALAQQGHYEAAWAALEQSLAEGLSATARFEIALTREAMARVAPFVQPRKDGSALMAEAVSQFEQLGVVSTPVVPLPPMSVGWEKGPGPQEAVVVP